MIAGREGGPATTRFLVFAAGWRHVTGPERVPLGLGEEVVGNHEGELAVVGEFA